MNPQTKSLIWGILLGLFISMLAWFNLPHKDLAPPVDIKPYLDTIEQERRGRMMAEARVKYWLWRADSAEHLLLKSKKKRDADIKIIEAFTPDSRLRWNDSVLRTAGLR